MQFLVRRIREFHSNEQGISLIESVAWTGAIAVTLWAIYAVLSAGAPAMVGAWTHAGINQRDLWEGRGTFPGGWVNPPPISNPNYNGAGQLSSSANPGTQNGAPNNGVSARAGGSQTWWAQVGDWFRRGADAIGGFLDKNLMGAAPGAGHQ